MGAGFMAGSKGRREGRGRIPPWAGPTALMVVSAFFLGVVFWGFLNPPDLRVEYFDAGRADSFTIGELTAFPERNLYVVGMEDGRLRAIDARVEESGCVAQWLPNDERGRPYNPGRVPGVFEDPCSGATWSMIANAIQGSDEPLRTPHIDYRPDTEGKATHAFIEHINP